MLRSIFRSSNSTVPRCMRTLWLTASWGVQALVDKNNLYIVTPFYSGGELFDTLIDRTRFEEDEARPLFRQALEALRCLKKRGVCHRWVVCCSLAIPLLVTEL